MQRHYYVKHERVDNRHKRITVKYYRGGSAAIVTDHNLSEYEMHQLLMRAKENTKLYGEM